MGQLFKELSKVTESATDDDEATAFDFMEKIDELFGLMVSNYDEHRMFLQTEIPDLETLFAFVETLASRWADTGNGGKKKVVKKRTAGQRGRKPRA